MKPQPSGGFEWVQAMVRHALVCRAPTAAVRRHLFTTRDGAWGPAPAHPDEDWRPVGGSLGVERDPPGASPGRCTGPAVVVRPSRRSPAVDDRRLPEADIFVSDDPSMVLAIQTADCVPLLMRIESARRLPRRTRGGAAWPPALPQRGDRSAAREFGLRPREPGRRPSARQSAPSATRSAKTSAADSPPPDLSIRSSRAGFARVRGWIHWLFDGWRSALESARVSRRGGREHSSVRALHRDLSGPLLLVSPGRCGSGADGGCNQKAKPKS
jgi:hypothetical protein